jgi:hypothetical protein
MDLLFVILAFTIGAVAGSALNQKDPVSALLSAARRRGVGFIVASLSVGFAAGMLFDIFSAAR